MTWKSEVPSFVGGLEVINLRKLWQETWYNETSHFFHSLFIYPFNPRLALIRLIAQEEKEFELWDKTNLKRRLIGVLGNQTTSRIFSAMGIAFSFPSYKESFEFASNHILLESELTGNANSDRAKIFKALEKGEFYFSFDSLGSPKGFAAYVKRTGRYYLPGNKISVKKRTHLVVDLPKNISIPVEIKLLKDGQIISMVKNDNGKFEISSPGNYRVEVHVQPKLPFPESSRWVPWIFTNNFYFN